MAPRTIDCATKKMKKARQQHGETSCTLEEPAILLEEEEKEDNWAVKPGGSHTHEK